LFEFVIICFSIYFRNIEKIPFFFYRGDTNFSSRQPTDFSKCKFGIRIIFNSANLFFCHDHAWRFPGAAGHVCPQPLFLFSIFLRLPCLNVFNWARGNTKMTIYGHELCSEPEVWTYGRMDVCMYGRPHLLLNARYRTASPKGEKRPNSCFVNVGPFSPLGLRDNQLKWIEGLTTTSKLLRR